VIPRRKPRAAVEPSVFLLSHELVLSWPAQGVRSRFSACRRANVRGDLDRVLIAAAACTAHPGSCAWVQSRSRQSGVSSVISANSVFIPPFCDMVTKQDMTTPTAHGLDQAEGRWFVSHSSVCIPCVCQKLVGLAMRWKYAQICFRFPSDQIPFR